MSSVEPQTPYNEYPNVDGVTTVFPYEFQLLAAADLVVTVDNVVIPSSAFILTGVGVQAGGDVTFNVAPLAGATVLLSRVIALQRNTDYQYNGDLKETTVDNDFNRLWQALQGFFSRLTGTVRAPYPEQLSELPPAASRANNLLAFDGSGNPTVMVPQSGSAADVLLQLANDTDPTKGDALVAVRYPNGGVGVARTQHGKNLDVVTIRDIRSNNFGQDLGPLLQTFVDQADAGTTLDLLGLEIGIGTPFRLPDTGFKIKNGRFRLLGTEQWLFAVVPGTDSEFHQVSCVGEGNVGSGGVPLYQGFVHSGTTDVSRPIELQREPRDGVKFYSCNASNSTVGWWIGGSSLDHVPDGWQIVDCSVRDIVGTPNLSEGYGWLLSPATNCLMQAPRAKTVRRHAIYLAGGAQHNVLDTPIIDGVDNIAIQFNAFPGQLGNDDNTILSPVVRNVTKSIAYGYRSSIAIGVYGNASRTRIFGGRLSTFLDTGIEFDGTLGGEDNSVLGTYIDARNASDAALRTGVQNGFTARAIVELAANIYAGVYTGANGGTKPSSLQFDVRSAGTGAIVHRSAISAGTVYGDYESPAGVVATGFLVSGAGTFRTASNFGVGVHSADAGLAYTAGGSAVTDRAAVRLTGTLSAARDMTLTKVVVPENASVEVSRTGGGGFAFNVLNGPGGATLKALATGQWGRFTWDGTNWVLSAFGSL